MAATPHSCDARLLAGAFSALHKQLPAGNPHQYQRFGLLKLVDEN
jgi:hypothetical protein